MSIQLKHQLQDILQSALEAHRFDRAEKAVHYIKELTEMEAFISGASTEDKHIATQPSASKTTPLKESTAYVQNAAAFEQMNAPLLNRRDTLILQYVEEENILKFKKAPQTYAVSVGFFRAFLQHLKSWQEEKPFSSKDFYDEFAEDLQKLSTYQPSTLRQFITLLFRFCFKLDILEKPDPPQRSRFCVSASLDEESLIYEIIGQKILYL